MTLWPATHLHGRVVIINKPTDIGVNAYKKGLLFAWPSVSIPHESVSFLRRCQMPGVEDVEALLGAKLQHMHKQQQPRSARVNTLKMSVPQALAWLRSPPPVHSAFASKVFNYQESASVSAKEDC